MGGKLRFLRDFTDEYLSLYRNFLVADLAFSMERESSALIKPQNPDKSPIRREK